MLLSILSAWHALLAIQDDDALVPMSKPLMDFEAWKMKPHGIHGIHGMRIAYNTSQADPKNLNMRFLSLSWRHFNACFQAHSVGSVGLCDFELVSCWYFKMRCAAVFRRLSSSSHPEAQFLFLDVLIVLCFLPICEPL